MRSDEYLALRLRALVNFFCGLYGPRWERHVLARLGRSSRPSRRWWPRSLAALPESVPEVCDSLFLRLESLAESLGFRGEGESVLVERPKFHALVTLQSCLHHPLCLLEPSHVSLLAEGVPAFELPAVQIRLRAAIVRQKFAIASALPDADDLLPEGKAELVPVTRGVSRGMEYPVSQFSSRVRVELVPSLRPSQRRRLASPGSPLAGLSGATTPQNARGGGDRLARFPLSETPDFLAATRADFGPVEVCETVPASDPNPVNWQMFLLPPVYVAMSFSHIGRGARTWVRRQKGRTRCRSGGRDASGKPGRAAVSAVAAHVPEEQNEHA